MNQPYTAPEYGKDAFHCVWCRAYARQFWHDSRYGTGISYTGPVIFCECGYCQHMSIWLTEGRQLLYPGGGTVPMPHPDMPMDVQTDYFEARDIVSASPRGAAALLRLSIHKLCGELGGAGKNINSDVANLVKNGLSVKIQQALDIVSRRQ